MFTILILTISTLLLFIYFLYPKAQGAQPIIQTQPAPKQEVAKKIDDSNLRRVSICTNKTLFDKDFNLIPSMAQLIPVLGTKYRLYLVTQVPNDGSEEHRKAQQFLETFSQVQNHRKMFCTTSKGKESIVRQLSAEMHIDSDVDFCCQMQRFISKFHLVTDDVRAESIQKESNGKIVLFKNLEQYCAKIMQQAK